MSDVKVGQLRRSSPLPRGETTYLVLGPSHLKDKWLIMRFDSHEVQSWWQKSIEKDEILKEAE